MILNWLIKHQWKESIRSILWHRNLATNIFLGVVLVLLFLNILGLGLFIDRLFENKFPDKDPVVLFNGILIYYFLADLILRYFLQKMSGIYIQPYLHLPVARTRLIHFLLFKSLLTFFNVLPLLLLIPFALNVILPAETIVATLAWLMTVYAFVLGNSLFKIYLERQTVLNPGRVIAILFAVILVALGDYLGYIPLSKISAGFFGMYIRQPYLIFLPVLILASIYRLDFTFFKIQLYPEKLLGKQTQLKFAQAGFSYFDRWGKVGEYIALELKLLLRNKRARSSQLIAVFVLVLGPLFYSSIGRELNYYPQPDPATIKEKFVAENSPNQCRITFRVIPGEIPEKAHVYITGDHIKLGKWRPAYIPLHMAADSSWSRTFYFDPGTSLRYIYTLGSWATELGKSDGKTPHVQSITVQNDTTIVMAQPNWKTPHRPVFFDIFFIYMGLLFTGILMLTYGQFMFSWESNYFELLITRGINFKTYLTAKYILLIVCGCIFYLLSIPYAFISLTILEINSVSFIYNIGINSFVLLILVTYTRKRMDLNASIFATQGKGASHFLTIVPTIILPVVLYLPFALSGYGNTGFIFMAGLGVLGLLFHRQLLTFSLRQFQHQKYNIAAGFRQA